MSGVVGIWYGVYLNTGVLSTKRLQLPKLPPFYYNALHSRRRWDGQLNDI